MVYLNERSLKSDLVKNGKDISVICEIFNKQYPKLSMCTDLWGTHLKIENHDSKSKFNAYDSKERLGRQRNRKKRPPA